MALLTSHRAFPARRLVAVVTLGAFLAACTKWSVRPLVPSEFPSTNDPASTSVRQVRLTLASGAQVVVSNPWVSSDSLMWLGPEFGEAGGPVRPQGVPMSEVARVEVHGFDPYGTTLLAAGIGLSILLIAAAGSNSPGGGGGGGSYAPCQSGSPGCQPISCPVLYSWDGKHWHLDSGTFGGAILEALARTDVDNLDFVRPDSGEIRLRLADIAPETDHVDAVTLLAVDHDPDVTVAPDGAGNLHTLGPMVGPVAARDDRGRDVLPQVQAADGWNWESALGTRDTLDPRALRDGIELTFVRPASATTARIVLDGNNTPWAAAMVQRLVAAHGRDTRAWYDSMAAAPATARTVAAKLAGEGFLTASLRESNRWAPQGAFWEAGPEVVKRQVLPIDLSRVSGDTIHLRLESVPSFWLIDHVALDFTPERAATVTPLQPETAVTTDGRDVRAELTTADGRYFAMHRGDAAVLTYRVPPIQPGLSRTYLVRTTGWYRVDSPDAGTPDAQTLATLTSRPLGLARVSVGAMNVAVRKMGGRLP